MSYTYSVFKQFVTFIGLCMCGLATCVLSLIYTVYCTNKCYLCGLSCGCCHGTLICAVCLPVNHSGFEVLRSLHYLLVVNQIMIFTALFYNWWSVAQTRRNHAMYCSIVLTPHLPLPPLCLSLPPLSHAPAGNRVCVAMLSHTTVV